MLRVRLPLLALGLLPGLLAAQQPSASVRGVVHDVAGRPLAGAEIVVGRRSATTGADGRFVLDSLATTRHLLVVRLIGYSPVRAELDLSDGRPRDVEYQLEEAGVRLPMIVVEGARGGIWGTVGDPELRPLAGALVEARGPRGGQALVDSSGQFAFPRAVRGQYLIRVTHPGFTARSQLVEVQASGKELAVILTPGVSMASRAAEQAAVDLGQRLSFGLARERIGSDDLQRRGSVALCDMPRIRTVINRGGVLIINGVTIIRADDGSRDLLNVLCAWRADEVELVEFGERICSEQTHLLAALVGTTCTGGRTRRSLSGAQAIIPGNPPYVVVWERP